MVVVVVVVAAEVEGKPRLRLRLEGLLERDGQIFETFRVRYRVPVPAGGAAVPLVFEAALRPGQRFLLRLRVVDEGSEAQAVLARSLAVPSDPVSRLGALVEGAAPGEALPPGLGRRDSLLLLPPVGEVLIGAWRAEALVAGDRIQKVVFLVDGQPQLTRTLAPFSAEVRLDPFPREQVVRAEGYDANGELVAADQVVLNQARGTFRVTLEEPRRGSRSTGRVTARADVVVPEEQSVAWVEFKVNDAPVARLTEPPWQTPIDVPPGEDTAWVSVTARLEDGAETEDVRFLRAPANLEEMDVDLVELYAAVTDGSGRFLRGLEAKDFEVLEDGRPQELARFEMVESFPITLGFIVDTSTSMADALVECFFSHNDDVDADSYDSQLEAYAADARDLARTLLCDPLTAQARVTAVLRQSPETPVLVKGDRRVDYGQVVDAMLMLQSAGAAKVGTPITLAQSAFQAFEETLKEVNAAWSRQDLAGLQRLSTPEMAGDAAV